MITYELKGSVSYGRLEFVKACVSRLPKKALEILSANDLTIIPTK